MKPIRVFLLKGKESMIDHVKSIQTLGCAYWKKSRNKKLEVGDICYLYLIGKGHYQVRYRLEVVDTSCVREDSSCWITPFQADENCYKLIPTFTMYEGKELSLDTLEEIGINRHTQFKELNEFQEDFFKQVF
ncbi:hypothetical protein NXW94_27730 [Bacteroides ovatus]|nr:hypothetical protein [Bacteroides ovatus]